MRELDLHFLPNEGDIAGRVSELISSLELRDFDKERWRSRVEAEFEIRSLSLPKHGEAGFLAADSSVAKQNLRYHALWSMHCVSLYGLFDGRQHDDPLVGHGSVDYSNLMYDSAVDLGSFEPYWMIEQQMNHIRVAREYSSIAGNFEALRRSGVQVDYALVDGSLETNHQNLSMEVKLATADAALEAQRRLLDLKKVVSMAEDSHASGISRRLGLSMSNLMLFDLILRGGEYVVDEGRFNVCYIKLPGKRLSYLEGLSSPLSVRWEFSYGGFEDDLNLLASIWLRDADLLHPQLYPLRIADYLTRRIKASGLISQAVEETKADLEFREMREY